MSEEQGNSFGVELDRLVSEWAEALQNDEMEKASIAMNAIWVMFQIMSIATTAPDLKELTYLKTPFTFDNGGKYILTLLHVEGPKIQLQGASGNGYTKKFEEIK